MGLPHIGQTTACCVVSLTTRTFPVTSIIRPRIPYSVVLRHIPLLDENAAIFLYTAVVCRITDFFLIEKKKKKK